MSDRRKGLLFLAGGLLCFLAAFGLIWVFTDRWKAEDPTTEAGSAIKWMEPAPETDADPENSGTAVKEELWVIYITGEVKVPGVYKVSPGARIYQVVDRAGGFTADADAVAINMARPLQDGDHVHVPSRAETVPGGTGEVPRSVIRNDGVVLSEAAPSGIPDKVDLNRCTSDRLETLPGIGPKTAAAIVLFREEHGLFRSVEDLIQVQGIGPAKMEKIRGLVTVRP